MSKLSGCVKPLHAFKIADDNGNGKPLYKITSGDVDHIGDIWTFKEIPCGRCVACRLAYSRQWADRCMLEASQYDSNFFVTLTYDDDHLPFSDVVDSETGEIVHNATLVKRDLQLFFKRLRKAFPDQRIRYYACGEYGSKTYRPHYHAIIFNLHLDDLVLYKQTFDGYNYFNSPSIDRVWKHGYVVLTNVTWDTCAYTARYILKKKFGSSAEFYDRYKIEPEFTTMSRRPGIGRQFYDDHKDSIFESDYIYLGSPDGSRSIKPPRYFERLFDEENPDYFVARKKLADRSNRVRRNTLIRTSGMPYLDVLKMEEDNLNARLRSLRRKEF